MAVCDLKRWIVPLISLWTAITLTVGVAQGAPSASDKRTIALLDVTFRNDNEAFEPVSDSERRRIAGLKLLFKRSLEATGRFTFVPLTPDVLRSMSEGPLIGHCNGCETDLGRRLGAGTVAWIEVQKVSNLILNMTVYMADVSSNRLTFVQSVDMRGNTDESWTRALTYLLDNYLLPHLSS